MPERRVGAIRRPVHQNGRHPHLAPYGQKSTLSCFRTPHMNIQNTRCSRYAIGTREKENILPTCSTILQVCTKFQMHTYFPGTL